VLAPLTGTYSSIADETKKTKNGKNKKCEKKQSSLVTPVTGLIFETKNREIFLERFFWREITAREQVSPAVILEKF